MQVVELVEQMQSISEQLRRDGHRIALVPTMGCLHRGHASLIEEAHRYGQAAGGSRGPSCHEMFKDAAGGGGQKKESPRSIVMVSIFTNPTQFNSVTDYMSYDKNLEADLGLCERLKVDYVFLPNCAQMYPPNQKQHTQTSTLDVQLIKANTCTVQPPDSPLNNELEGRSRPGHFRGMLTVVCKLFNITMPHVAYFGEKDYQQLVLVRRMVRDLNMRVDICSVGTVRDHDLLPLSSRNARLTVLERKLAPIMYRMLHDANKSQLNLQESYKSRLMTQADLDLDVLLFASALLTCASNLSRDEQHLFQVDYLELRCAEELSKVRYQNDLNLFDCDDGCVRGRLNEANSSKSVVLTGRLLTSVIVGGVRLLDNIEVHLNS